MMDWSLRIGVTLGGPWIVALLTRITVHSTIVCLALPSGWHGAETGVVRLSVLPLCHHASILLLLLSRIVVLILMVSLPFCLLLMTTAIASIVICTTFLIVLLIFCTTYVLM